MIQKHHMLKEQEKQLKAKEIKMSEYNKRIEELKNKFRVTFD